jgi:deoxyribodipyrimidine photo-lyase
MEQKMNIHWFRRDLRLADNTALYHALKSQQPVQPIFIFDKEILSKLTEHDDKRVNFIYQSILQLKDELEKLGATLWIFYGSPIEVWSSLISQHVIQEVFINHDYEPYGMNRDASIKALLAEKNIKFHSFKDIVIFEKDEVTKEDGKPYTVYTPYNKKWKAKLKEIDLQSYPTEKYFDRLRMATPSAIPAIETFGFARNENIPSRFSLDKELVKDYHLNRNYPGIVGTSRAGIHLRFGTISIRQLAKDAQESNEVYLNELIWRDFYHQILHHFPQVVTHSFKPQYDLIKWRNNENEYQAWCEGKTGYPIVDAGMRELNTTGFMHNRVRMITASFLCKHLLIDWRWGENYFAKKLLDFDLAANNGGWQWAAGSGTDAAPYFRIFSPSEQTKKFDTKLTYIRHWVPELDSLSYPSPIVKHELARERCLRVYKEGLAQGS